ncbi:MAG: indole-3-glycerol phosphate synthase TrpC [Candidatus Thermofonsia Clade 1 bacterium]|jgi:indole-3-glycerol phosphate synthase|uniref:Indole-3-glycerol phosphate synthase n=1 Tax=Candidatus Thermofonsia Clade 1 bacterium TaxID=2364210 RepID=A0A2M8PH39_9CHLR|nr:MAG: indole-3-glycerol phosphate synthase TrpC [Candidatus Thermofonsia Clade 1 bacterium]RMF53667.1 MAG: indole-3-glycerol phosphate synthase TrpC [Chloroflexota bacterium]
MQAGIQRTETILDRIVARKIEELAHLDMARLPKPDSPPRPFAAALRRADGRVALIAEIKRASPSRGVLIADFQPASLAEQYASGGATALSVLTDRDFFMGSLEDLQAARRAAELPVLRKDFIIDERQIVEARAYGADAILLIAAILDDAKLRDLIAAANAHGLAALVEVHTQAELERVLQLDVALIGINNRDLRTFKVDLNTFRTLAPLVPAHLTLVAESGIYTAEDVAVMAAHGAHAILVGESLVKAPDIAAQVRQLSAVLRRA